MAINAYKTRSIGALGAAISSMGSCFEWRDDRAVQMSRLSASELLFIYYSARAIGALCFTVSAMAVRGFFLLFFVTLGKYFRMRLAAVMIRPQRSHCTSSEAAASTVNGTLNMTLTD